MVAAMIDKFIIEALKGMRQALVISPGRAYVRPANNAFRIDAANLRNDAKKVGDDLKKYVI